MKVRVPAILVVDDEQPVRDFLEDALQPMADHLCIAADLKQAMQCMESHAHDVLLADICMPGCSGMDLLALSVQLQWDCSVILMTGHASMDQVVNGVRLRASDFLLKPFSMETLEAAIQRAYEVLLGRRHLKIEQEKLTRGLRERTEQLETIRQALRSTYHSAIETMIATLEARESETCAHSFRVRAYALHLARQIDYPTTRLPELIYSALLHDIGKIAVSDAILLKPGPLTPQEFEILKVHSVAGEKIVSRMGFLSEAPKIIRHHHERWDGRGYPDRLQGEAIPIESRLFAIADTIDAMTSTRCYRAALTFDDARKEIERCAGTQFDPALAAVAITVPEMLWKDLRQGADSDWRAASLPDPNLIQAPTGGTGLLLQFPAAVSL